MTLGVGIFLIAVGAVLRFAVHAPASSVNLGTVGWILMGVGAAAVLLSLTLWSSFYDRPRGRGGNVPPL